MTDKEDRRREKVFYLALVIIFFGIFFLAGQESYFVSNYVACAFGIAGILFLLLKCFPTGIGMGVGNILIIVIVVIVGLFVIVALTQHEGGIDLSGLLSKFSDNQ